MGLLIFVSAGTVRYWQAWVYLSIFFGASALTTSYLIRHDPVLLERRMSGGPTAEKRVVQKFIMLCTSALGGHSKPANEGRLKTGQRS